ncbi:MFS transporter [Actibacterium lipolyticum]|uniref:Major Facilitator Superfamily protein n=1 Tax=Actibacterium lipolyticum TaxID=1524263 RepID=A0A238JZS5_9RHOB|nr:MFS transporter [Actibacterium lipolyticum]SMX35206.1 Major Facilitator Superfamily protein [Actibacterium lipolyticum]
MFRVLSHPVYARLFMAQVIALTGTGLLTVALGLLAFDLAGAQAGAVLGTAYAIKMVAYVGLSPIAAALTEHLPRKAVLIGADVIRAAVALLLPFIDAVWQIYALIFILQAASATFTPAFQATIPDILSDEAEYTKALSLSRLAYDLENLLSPALAGMLLAVVSYHWLFAGTVFGFVGSALLVAIAALPRRSASKTTRPFRERLTRGTRIYLATPRLRGLLALTLTAASSSAFVLVNTVVVVRAGYGLDDAHLAYALAAFGAGSMISALSLPRLLENRRDRSVMVPAGAALALGTLALSAYMFTAGLPSWPAFLITWGLFGLLYAAIMTPSGRLLRRSAHPADRQAVFTAQFALSHACWLVAYPVAGWVGQGLGLPSALAVLGVIGLIGAIAARRLWPVDQPEDFEHSHADLPPDHPHLKDHPAQNKRHTHAFVIDDEHRVWPSHG